MISYNNLKRIHMELSSNCNASCPNCPRNVDGGFEVPWIDKKSITLEQFKTLISVELLQQIESFLFCGNYGDPVMCLDLPDIVKYVRDNSQAQIKIHTNGGLRSHEWWTKLATNLKQSDIVVFSIDGLADTNSLYRRNVIWDKLMQNTKTFINAGGNAHWEFLIFQHNQHQLETARETSKELGFSSFIPKKAFGFDFMGNDKPRMRVLDKDGNFSYFIYEPDVEFQNKNVFGKEEVNEAAIAIPKIEYKKTYDVIKKDVLSNLNIFKDLSNGPIDCMSYNSKEIYIDANLGVHPCCFLGHSSQTTSTSPDNLHYYKWLDENIGFDNINAQNKTIEQILNSDYFKKISDTWKKTNTDGRISVCSRMCAKDHNPIKELYNVQ